MIALAIDNEVREVAEASEFVAHDGHEWMLGVAR
jgi:hypothetical protein